MPLGRNVYIFPFLRVICRRSMPVRSFAEIFGISFGRSIDKTAMA